MVAHSGWMIREIISVCAHEAIFCTEFPGITLQSKHPISVGKLHNRFIDHDWWGFHSNSK